MGFWMLLENLVCIGSISLWETLYEKNNTDVRVKKKKSTVRRHGRNIASFQRSTSLQFRNINSNFHSKSAGNSLIEANVGYV